MTQTPMMTLPKRLESIQALRGVAALLVLFFHLAAFQSEMAAENPADIVMLTGIWDNGWAGVDLFFVISGFIMVYVTRQTGRSFGDVKRFLVSRVTRIYPLWWVCAGIMAFYFWITYGMPAAPDRVSGPSEAFAYAAKSFFLIPQSSEPILGLGWTLIHEMFFYIVFAGLLFLPRKYLIWALLVWALFTLVGSQFVTPSSFGRNIPELLTSPLSLEFIAGGLAGYLVSKTKIYASTLIFFSGIVAAIIALFIFPTLTDINYTISRVSIFMMPFVLLTYGWVGCELRGDFITPKWLSRLGDWSYSLYLTHYIVLISLRRVYRWVVPEGFRSDALGLWDNLIFAILAVAMSIFTASVFYNFIERPSLNFFKKRRA